MILVLSLVVVLMVVVVLVLVLAPVLASDSSCSSGHCAGRRPFWQRLCKCRRQDGLLIIHEAAESTVRNSKALARDTYSHDLT